MEFQFKLILHTGLGILILAMLVYGPTAKAQPLEPDSLYKRATQAMAANDRLAVAENLYAYIQLQGDSLTPDFRTLLEMVLQQAEDSIRKALSVKPEAMTDASGTMVMFSHVLPNADSLQHQRYRIADGDCAQCRQDLDSLKNHLDRLVQKYKHPRRPLQRRTLEPLH